MNLRTIVVAAILLLPASHAARAQCVGQDLTETWSAAQQTAVDEATALHPYPEGRFWEVSRDGRTSTLFGTIHLTDEDVASPPPELVDRVGAARLLFLEVTRREEQRMQRAMILNPSIVLAPEGKRLRPLLSNTEWKILEAAAAPLGINADAADRISPWFLTLALSTPSCVLQGAYSGKLILDRRIEKVAEEAGITVAGLETYEDLFAMLGIGAYEEQAELLRLSLPALSQSEDLMVTTKSLYKRGEIMKIWEAGGQILRDRYGAEVAAQIMESTSQTLLVLRNKAWMETLLPELDRGDVVVAVGALHLGGEYGLLHLLEQEGFAIRRLGE